MNTLLNAHRDGAVLLQVFESSLEGEMKSETPSAAAGLAFLAEVYPPGAEALQKALADKAPDLFNVAAAAIDGLYSREGLAKRERQATTLGALAALGAWPQFKIHVGIAGGLGFSRAEILEICLQIAPYAGLPTAINATLAALEVLDAAGGGDGAD